MRPLPSGTGSAIAMPAVAGRMRVAPVPRSVSASCGWLYSAIAGLDRPTVCTMRRPSDDHTSPCAPAKPNFATTRGTASAATATVSSHCVEGAAGSVW